MPYRLLREMQSTVGQMSGTIKTCSIHDRISSKKHVVLQRSFPRSKWLESAWSLLLEINRFEIKLEMILESFDDTTKSVIELNFENE